MKRVLGVLVFTLISFACNEGAETQDFRNKNGATQKIGSEAALANVKPDLIIEGASFNANGSIHFILRNIGNATATDFGYHVGIPGTDVGTTGAHVTLPPGHGESIVTQMSNYPSKMGQNVSVTVRVDQANAVSELLETNNALTISGVLGQLTIPVARYSFKDSNFGVATTTARMIAMNYTWNANGYVNFGGGSCDLGAASATSVDVERSLDGSTNWTPVSMRFDSQMLCVVYDDNVEPNTIYHYRMRAKNSVGSGPWSYPFSTRTTPGFQPNSLRADYVNSDRVDLVWNGEWPFVGPMTVQKQTNGPWATIRTINEAATHNSIINRHSDSNVTSSTTYKYRVCNPHACSTEITVNTPAAFQIPANAIFWGFSARNDGEGKILLRWNRVNPSNVFTTYKLLRYKQGQIGKYPADTTPVIINLPASAVSYQDTTVKKYSIYEYFLEAYNGVNIIQNMRDSVITICKFDARYDLDKDGSVGHPDYMAITLDRGKKSTASCDGNNDGVVDRLDMNADCDSDGVQTGNDFLNWQRQLGQIVLNTDLDRNGMVEDADRDILDNYCKDNS